MGITLREVIYDIGGGIPRQEIQGCATGWAFGGCVPAEHLDVAN